MVQSVQFLSPDLFFLVSSVELSFFGRTLFGRCTTDAFPLGRHSRILLRATLENEWENERVSVFQLFLL